MKQILNNGEDLSYVCHSTLSSLLIYSQADTISNRLSLRHVPKTQTHLPLVVITEVWELTIPGFYYWNSPLTAVLEVRFFLLHFSFYDATIALFPKTKLAIPCSSFASPTHVRINPNPYFKHGSSCSGHHFSPHLD
jgi:sensor histidine kinase YesM